MNVRRFLALVVAATALAACGSGGEGSSASSTGPPSTGATSSTTAPATGPGAPIADRLVVPAGAQLLGRVFPVVPGETSRDHVWTALLVVGDDGRSSFVDLLHQAAEAGYAMDTERTAECERREADVVLTCSVDLVGNGAEIGATTETSACGPLGATHMVLEARPSTRYGTVGGGGTTATFELGASETVPIPDDPLATGQGPPPSTARPLPSPPRIDPDPPLPGTGDLLDERDDDTSTPVRLEPGSRLAGRPYVPCDSFTQGMAVLVLDDGVRPVLDAYAEQFERAGGEPGGTSTVDVLDPALTVTELTMGFTGGPGYEIWAVEEPGRPTFALVRATYDA